MAEYVLSEGEDQEKVAQELLANADHPDHVIWRPRSGVPYGGVYEIEDGLAERLIAHRRAVAEAEAERIEAAQAAADERDTAEGVAEGLVTPLEAGFAASTGTDPGAPPPAPVEGDDLDDAEEADGDEPAATDPADEPAADEATETPARRKNARRRTAPADEPALQNTEKE